MTDEALFQPLADRIGGRPVDTTTYDEVPGWLIEPLRGWIHEAMAGDEVLARRIVMRLRWSHDPFGKGYIFWLTWCNGDQILTVIDAILQLNTSLWAMVELLRHRPDINRTEPVQQLTELLADGSSRYTVDVDRHCLTVLLDPTIAAAADQAVAADPTAGDHLRLAFAAAYGLNPDPDKAYDEAVLAVEAVACPLVCPNDSRRTLGTVIRDLRNQASQWALAITDSSGLPASPVRLVEILALLWEGQSRHAGSPNSRRQSQAEAEAAVHLAAVLVKWLIDGVLYRR
ncbi:hypothetical protein [Dactylosporangium darangshiense]|uniref:Uncharacterized protein n=1 Tax=Dactylosporangium darangshiense TaxID=579108 RepID=A0ABP8DN90_9ACTN